MDERRVLHDDNGIEMVVLGDNGGTSNDEIREVNDGEVLLNTTQAVARETATNGVRTPSPFWRVGFFIFHILFLATLISELISGKLISMKNINATTIILLVLIGCALILVTSLLFYLYSWLVRVLGMIGKYKILVRGVGVLLHQILVLNGKSDQGHQLLFAFHMTSIICYIRNEVEGDPSGFILIMTLAFVRSATSYYKMHNLLFGVYVVAAICAVVASICSEDETATMIEKLKRRATLLGHIAGGIEEGHQTQEDGQQTNS